MIATITGIKEQPKGFTGKFYYIFFRGEDQKCWKMCVGSAFRNFKKWEPIISMGSKAVGVICEGLRQAKSGCGMPTIGVLDADYLEKTRIAQLIGGEHA